MQIVTGITTQPSQQLALTLDDGTLVGVLLTYIDQQTGWFANFTGPFACMPINGLRLTASPNVLRQWKRILDFGLGIARVDGTDPLLIGDLADPQTTILLLNSSDLATIESTLYPGLP